MAGDEIWGWVIFVAGGVTLLHVARAHGDGTLNFDGDWIDRSDRPKVFRWAAWTEAGLGLLLLIVGLAVLLR